MLVLNLLFIVIVFFATSCHCYMAIISSTNPYNITNI